MVLGLKGLKKKNFGSRNTSQNLESTQSSQTNSMLKSKSPQTKCINLYVDGMQQMKKRNESFERRQRSIEIQEIQECTFKPSLVAKMPKTTKVNTQVLLDNSSH